MARNRVFVFVFTLIFILSTLLACTPQAQKQLNEAVGNAASTASAGLQTQVSSSGQTAVAEGIHSVQTQAPALQQTAETALKTEAARVQTEVAKGIASLMPPSGDKQAPLVYFALGDSIASGHGLMDQGDCRRSEKSYPYQLKALLLKQYQQVDFKHLACSGATVGIPNLNFLEMLGDKRFQWFNTQVDEVLSQLDSQP